MEFGFGRSIKKDKWAEISEHFGGQLLRTKSYISSSWDNFTLSMPSLDRTILLEHTNNYRSGAGTRKTALSLIFNSNKNFMFGIESKRLFNRFFLNLYLYKSSQALHDNILQKNRYLYSNNNELITRIISKEIIEETNKIEYLQLRLEQISIDSNRKLVALRYWKLGKPPSKSELITLINLYKLLHKQLDHYNAI